MSSVFNLAKNYNRKRLFEKVIADNPDITYILLQSAKQNDAEALKKIGDLYYVQDEYLIAMAWYLRASNGENAEAQFKVGTMLYYGDGQCSDSSLAYEFINKSGENGNLNAQNFLGWLYYHGQVVSKNLKEAAHWYYNSASQGHTEAQYWLAFMYEKGEGIEKNKDKAIEWYEKSATLGFEKAQHRLAALKKEQSLSGIEQDKEESSHQNDIFSLKEKVSSMENSLINLQESVDHINAQNREILEILKVLSWSIKKI